MKHLTIFFILCLFLSMTSSCVRESPIDYGAMHIYQPAELQKLIDNAVKIEMVGEPVMERIENVADSSTIIRTTGTYRVYVAITEDNQLIPVSDTATALKRATGGPIIITSSCDMTCKPVRPGESCNISGCAPNSRCGCTQGSCGNNCTTDIACHQWKGGFSFGTIIF